MHCTPKIRVVPSLIDFIYYEILGNLEKKELNRLEVEFLDAIDWNIYVSPDDYELTTQKLEWAVATKEVENRPGTWTTYTDINVLSRNLELIKVCMNFI